MRADDLAPLRRIGIFGYSMQLCRMLLTMMHEHGFFRAHKAAEQPYIDAQIRMLTDDPANIEKYLDGWMIYYRNHQNDKKGRLTRCEAYLMPK